MHSKFALKFIAACAIAASATAGFAQEMIKIANIVELSGSGATAGTNFKNGIELAVKEINASGGILGKQIQTTTSDTQSNPGVAKGLTQKAIDNDVFAIFGPVFSGSIMVSMAESRRAEVPNFTGGEAAAITEQGNPYVFRTSFTQATAMPKVARYMSDQAKLKTIAVIYVNNDFGKGGLDMLKKALEDSSTRITTAISTDAGQVDFSAAVLKAKQSNAEGVFVYSNEEESARILRELRKQGWTKPIIGETTLTGQKVIELAGDAANGAIAHVGLTVNAPVPAVRAFSAKFEKEYSYVSDHNGMKGYSGIYFLKAAIDKVGKLDRKAVADAMHHLKVNSDRYPGALMYTEFDGKGDLDRMSFMVEVKKGKQEVIAFVPPLGLRRKPVAVAAAPAPAPDIAAAAQPKKK
ncbi:ABC transporter substrate-binding protein [Polaromonas naphthalenivorans]|uniref:Amino acid/amide ABC transporter substrate-binding protein, HAAT family n=1 Tax=Polaromonas naphthalenivorans (strain CJ2) TaxID=365044 RepID=A1VTJ7_POLNA|nr:ABC transporter substrate-binding protein [Polaromonas naphthalenivorans]ABM38975.1 amino acid/amide ABC transporter substrate-binding protein, HAAT family [Polaromonas naphthalenivorans CJ2]